MIAIIDYGLGNLRSVEKAFEKEGFECIVTNDIVEIEKSDGIVLPGVGAFNDAVQNLKEVGLFLFIKEWIKMNKPFLGICLGFQLLFEYSQEAGKEIKGLEIFPGLCRKFKASKDIKVPQIGWNSIKITNADSKIMNGVKNHSYVYFVHSYYVDCEDEGVISTKAYYTKEFASSISYKNIFACQFHPEKSGDVGLTIIRNFGELTKEKRG